MSKNIDSSLLDKAIIFAVNAHKNVERKGKGFPYIVHPLEALSIVSTMTSDQELLAAAVLHDIIEDTTYTADDLRREFTDRVADLVISESDVYLPGDSEENSWHRRKQEAIDRIRNASYDSKIVAMGDKLSNMRAIARDYFQIGDKLWTLFHEKRRSEHEWHYRGLAWALEELSDTPAYKEFKGLIERVFSQAIKIDLNDYTLSGDGYTALSYNHNSGKTMIKLYKPFIPKEVPVSELTTANKVSELGIKTPEALNFVTDGERFGVEFRRVFPKKSFSRLIADNPECLESVVKTFALMCKDLHSTKCNCNYFPSQKDVCRKNIADNLFFTDEEKEPMFKFIDSVDDLETSLHGDMHIGNVITDGKENWWIDLADFAYGDPRFDLAIFYLQAFYISPSITEKLFHLSQSQLQTVWNVFIREYLATEDSAKVDSFEKELRPFAALTMVHFSSMDSSIPEELKNFVLGSF